MPTSFGLPCRVALTITFAAGMLTGSGCRKENEDSKIVTRDGKVTAINKETGIMEMSVFSPKANQDVPVSGRLDPACEILINGRTATVDDVQLGDVVKVTARRIRHGEGEYEYVVLKVEVDKPFAEDTAPAAPASPTTEP